MPASEKSTQDREEDREIVTTRIFDAPRDLVWQAWSEPQHLRHWWGPKGFRNTFETFEFKPGGLWHLTMHGPDGTDYPNEWVFVEIVPPSLIVLDHMFAPKFRVTATFEELDGKTKVTFRRSSRRPRSATASSHVRFRAMSSFSTSSPCSFRSCRETRAS